MEKELIKQCSSRNDLHNMSSLNEAPKRQNLSLSRVDAKITRSK